MRLLKNHVCTICNELEKQGQHDLANIIKETIMAITQAMCTSFKKELLEAKHNFLASGGNSFKLALYTSSATYDCSYYSVYSTSQEASGTNYTAGGAALTNINPTSSGTTAFTDFADLTFGNCYC